MTMPAGEDWNQLVGRTVELRRYGIHLRYGEVEVVSDDSSVMWLRFDGATGRQLTMKTDGYAAEEIDPIAGHPSGASVRQIGAHPNLTSTTGAQSCQSSV